jgi:dUTP pyrophosphatase
MSGLKYNFEGTEFIVSRVSPNAILPVRANPYDAGYDIAACEDAVIPARGKTIVNTGLAIQFPIDCYARIAPRSGLAAKNSIDVGAGVIDTSYSGLIKVILFNHSDTDFQVKIGDRIAQIIYEKIYTPFKLIEIEYEQLCIIANGKSDRGSGGFGSSGLSS